MWLDGDGVYYTYRDDMVDDLLKSHRLVGLSYHQLIQLLGEPSGKDSTSVSYEVKVKYDMIDPVYLKDLLFNFNKDSIITKAEIKEWKKN
jgi:hypothetical protein